ncbi:serine threonine protein kinase [Lentinula edodes]|uniref:Serine threonine protein kinase n=1 Tax=Lentinula edodes TaxID=5353 RepID=A0A1Q3EJI8_LENED|nr:serine threonine protein kinase [Lentinula edodes]
MLKDTVASNSSPEEDSLESLLSHDAQGRLQFGDPKKRHKRTTQALTTISAITEATRGLKAQIEAISSSHTSAEINVILCTVEDSSEALRRHISSVTRTAVSEEVKEARAMLDLLDQTVGTWRVEYPDSSPVKIDNRKYFFDPGEGKNAPTLIAYSIGLVSRIFERTAQRGASLTLKLLKLFGYFMAVLGNQELNPEQEATLAAIPESIETLERKFNLDIDCIPYAYIQPSALRERPYQRNHAALSCCCMANL